MEGSTLVDFVVAGFRVCQRLSHIQLKAFITFLLRNGCDGGVICDLACPEGKKVSHPEFEDENEDYMAVFAGIAMYVDRPETAALMMARFGLYGGGKAILKYQIEQKNPPGANKLRPLTDTVNGWINVVRPERVGRYKRSLDRDFRFREKNRPLKLRCPMAYDMAQKCCPQLMTAQCETRFSSRRALGQHLRALHIFDNQEFLRPCLNCGLVKWKSSVYRTKVEDLNLEMEHGLNCYPKNVPCLRGFIETPNNTLDGFRLPHDYIPPAMPHLPTSFLKVSYPAVYRTNAGNSLTFFRVYV